MMARRPAKHSSTNLKGIQDLLEVVHTLRKECPWDRKQTHQSLVPYLIEEAYEAVEAIESRDSKAVCEELGDVLLQIVMHAEIASEKKQFRFGDVAEQIAEKMKYRHPQIYQEAEIKNLKEHLQNWSRLKSAKNPDKKLLDGIPKSMPSLRRAQRYGEIASSVGFDWKKRTDVLRKVKEEIREWAEAIEKSSRKHQEEELGDLLFSLVQLARHLGFDSETALHRSCDKFNSRFSKIEKSAKKQKKEINDFSFSTLDQMWEQTKI